MICMALLLFISAIFALQGKNFLDTYRFNTSMQLLATEVEKAKFQSLIYRTDIDLVLLENEGGFKLAKVCDEPAFSNLKPIQLPAVAGVYRHGKKCKKLVLAKFSSGHCIASEKVELCNSSKSMKKEFYMKLSSNAFKQGEKIPTKYTCDGDDINPELSIQGVPQKAKSLVLIVDDPDVPKNLRPDGMYVHWVVFNVPPDTTSIKEDSIPKGTLGSGTGRLGYQGPCPPDRQHRYFFKLYALDKVLSLKEGADKTEVETAMKGHILASAELMGLYDRQRK